MKFDMIHVMDEMTANVKAAVIRATQAEAERDALRAELAALKEQQRWTPGTAAGSGGCCASGCRQDRQRGTT